MKFGIIGNTKKQNLREVLRELTNYFETKSIKYCLEKETAKIINNLRTSKNVVLSVNELIRKSDVVVALGGDGTMLSVARMIGSLEVPILGINLGKLGFLAEVTVEEMKDCFQDIISHNYLIEERMVIEAKIKNQKRIFYGLNDIVIDRGSYKRVIELETYVNNQYLATYSSDGLIITTPTGSTAYSLAVGGPLVTPGTNVLMINPIAAHSLTARPLVLPDSSIIRVKPRSNVSVHLTADGQDEKFIKPPCEISIAKAKHVVKLVKRKEHTYFELLRAKLFWGKDIRLDK